ncbi:MMPL family transporter [Compostimonas suwonensis]|uniref:MMPL family transporter n=1 Tax=Compostimonas suwonensis TaxID=1048394 RepID=UPI001FE7F967|nr:MMPL family transporter [Compostimonas suwonensis]
MVVAWALLLGIVATGFLLGRGPLSSSFDVPGTETARVAAELSEKLPDFGGASGTVVFHSTDGEALTADQRARISDVLATGEDLPDVVSVLNPFSVETQRSEQEQSLGDGRAQIGDARTQLDAAQVQLTAGREQLEVAQQQLDAAIEAAQADGSYAQISAAFIAQQDEVDSRRTALRHQQDAVDQNRTELDKQARSVEEGGELLALAREIRTVSADGTAAIASVSFAVPSLELSEQSRHAVMDHFSADPIPGVEVEFSSEIAQTVPEIIGPGEIAGVVIAAIVLLVMLGSLVAAGLPILNAVIGVAVGVLASLALSSVVDMVSVTPVLGVMLGLAVGIDYSLFILHRHRTQLRAGMELDESIGIANGTAGNAVVFAGSTVVVALLALNITGIPFVGVMGTVGAGCVVVAVLVAVTLTPALLGKIGTRVLGRRRRTDASAARPGVRHRRMSTTRAVVTAVVAAGVLLTVAFPALSMRLGLPDASSDPVDSTTYRAHAIVADEFGAGVNGTLLVTATLPAGLDEADAATAQLEVARLVGGQDDVVAVAPIGISDDHRLAAFQVVPREGPDSDSTEQLVRSLRALKIGSEGALGVAGQATGNIDISEKLASVLPIYLVVVAGLSLLIMIAVFRSFLVPLIATAGFLLSLFATFGVLVAVFQWGWLGTVFGVHSSGPVLSFLPIILIGILFGLAMDYQLFLASGMREAFVHGAPARDAVMQGFHAARTVVIAAGLIMVAVFGGFIFSDSIVVRALGIGLAAGVLADAFVVRLLLVPALMSLVGRAAWWLPRWLDRILPDLDVEGAKLDTTTRTFDATTRTSPS